MSPTPSAKKRFAALQRLSLKKLAGKLKKSKKVDAIPEDSVPVEIAEEEQVEEGYHGPPYFNKTSGRFETAPGQPLTQLSQNGTTTDVVIPEGYDLTGRDWLAFLFMTLGSSNVVYDVTPISQAPYTSSFILCSLFIRLVPFIVLDSRLLSCKTMGAFYPDVQRNDPDTRRKHPT